MKYVLRIYLGLLDFICSHCLCSSFPTSFIMLSLVQTLSNKKTNSTHHITNTEGLVSCGDLMSLLCFLLPDCNLNFLHVGRCICLNYLLADWFARPFIERPGCLANNGFVTDAVVMVADWLDDRWIVWLRKWVKLMQREVWAAWKGMPFLWPQFIE